MRARKGALRRCTPKSWSFRHIVFVIFVSGAAFLLFVHALGSIRRRKEKLIEEMHQDFAAFKGYLHTTGLKSREPALSRATRGPRQRGIVICAGGNTLLTNAYVSIKLLRNTFNNTMPVEIYHRGKGELNVKMKKAFSEFSDVRFVDLFDLRFPEHHAKPNRFNGYAQKIFSLYSTEFEQVFLLDADSQPLKDPSQLFQSASFVRTGNLFWSDFWGAYQNESPKEEVYKWLGLSPPWTYMNDWRSAESGQVLIDRVRHADVLEWLWFINSHAKLFYKSMLGDKDTFEMAFILAGKEALYNRVPHGPGMMLSKLQENVWRNGPPFFKRKSIEDLQRFLRLGMLQFDDLADPTFLHRTERTKFAQKWNGYSLDVMHPAWFVPPMSTNTTRQVRMVVWAMHSVPVSLADINCSCCTFDRSARAVLRRANISGVVGVPPDAPLGAGGCDPYVGEYPRLPLFAISELGPTVSRVMDAAFDAYSDLQRALNGRVMLRS